MENTAARYANLRKGRFTQDQAAQILGVTRATINRREKGKTDISEESLIAMVHLSRLSYGSLCEKYPEEMGVIPERTKEELEMLIFGKKRNL